MMQIETVRARGYELSVGRPESWSFVRRAVPRPVVPRELFAVSNGEVPVQDPASDTPRPMVGRLARDSVLVWCYYQAPDEPKPETRDRIPNYPEFRAPLRYDEAEVRRGEDAREWDPDVFTWSRVGFALEGMQVTVWISAGADASSASVDSLRAVISSIVVSSYEGMST